MDELEKTAQETAAEEQTGDTTAPDAGEDFETLIRGRYTTGRRGRRPLHALSLRGAKRRGNPFSFLGRIPTPVCGGAHGPRPTGHGGHAGRTESPVVMEYLPVPAR